jgi:hypothetical protein
MDEQLKSRFEKVLEHYAGIIKERDDALIREKTCSLLSGGRLQGLLENRHGPVGWLRVFRADWRNIFARHEGGEPCTLSIV